MRENAVCEKSFSFALNIIELYCRLKERGEYVMSKQLLRSGTSIGANVEEAVAAQSRKDFASKMAIAAKEARETRYWLRLYKKSPRFAEVSVTNELACVEELVRILTSIVKTTQENREPVASASGNS